MTFGVALPLLPGNSRVPNETSSAIQYLPAMHLAALTLAIAMAIAAVHMLRDNLIEVLDLDYCGWPSSRVFRPERCCFDMRCRTRSSRPST